MKRYNFDKKIDRRNTHSIRWGQQLANFGDSNNAIGMSIADMDFESPKEVGEAIKIRANHNLYGYTFLDNQFSQSFIDWYRRRHNIEICETWIVNMPNVIAILKAICHTFSKVGDAILIQTPVYPQFSNTVQLLNRTLITNPLKNNNNHYSIDFEDLELKLSKVKIMIFCSPHNPIGKIWSREDLIRVVKLCNKYNVKLICDEIHCDLIMPGKTFISGLHLNKEEQKNLFICFAGSKSFNCAGISFATLICQNEEYRSLIKNYIVQHELQTFSIFSSIGVGAAYQYGDQWMDEVNEYIYENYLYVKDFLEKEMPYLHHPQLEATYLMWFDFSKVFKTQEQLHCFMQEIQVAENQGTNFGSEGEQYCRINIATQRIHINEMLERMKKHIQKYL